MIKPCRCKTMAHAYCVTAHVLQNKRIYCQTCQEFYHLYMEKHSSGSVNFGLKNIAITISLWILVGIIVFLDGYIKCGNS